MALAGAILLAVHVCAGCVALLAAGGALATAKGGAGHVRIGRVYAAGMTAVFLTAVPMALLGGDTFLFFIAFFSFYLVFAGWRFARNRGGQAQPVDRAAVAVMGLAGLAMWAHALVLVLVRGGGDGRWIVLTVFGLLALATSLTDGLHFRRLRRCRAARARRISRHLSNMLAATISTVTAVLVVNVGNAPSLAWIPTWVVWLAPTALITPLIVWWNRRVTRPAGSAAARGFANRPIGDTL